MIKRTLLTAALATVHLTASASIEFSAAEQERSLEGVKFKLLFFKDNGKTIWYQPPRGWSVSGGSAGLKMTPPGLSQAQADIAQSPLPAPQAFEAEAMKLLQQKILASVPAESTKAAVVSEEKNPITVNGHQTYSVTVSYHAFGQDFLMSVLYLNLPDTQLSFRAVARAADFEKVHGAVRASLVSWQWRPDAPARTASK